MLNRTDMGSLCFKSPTSIHETPTCNGATSVVGMKHGSPEGAVAEWAIKQRLNDGALDFER